MEKKKKADAPEKAPSAPVEEKKEAEEISETAEAAPEEGKSEQEEKLQAALAEAEDLKRKWYSVTAEYENYRKRTAAQSAQRYLEGRADVVGKLFPIADNLARALASCESEGTRRGIELVVKAFEKVLEEEKITVIDPVGQPFDAEKCEAIMAVEPKEGETSGTVREVYVKGYEQNGKVLRFAQVIVVK